jgi:hypothetical protein
MSAARGAHDPVRSAHPPAWLMRSVVNPVSRALAGSPLGRRFGALTVLHFDGRRSGKRYAVPVMTYDHNGPVVFTDASWAANFVGGAPVVVRRGGRTHSGFAGVVSDPHEAADGLRAVLAGLRSPRGLGLVIDEGHVPSDAELNAVRRMIRIELAGS